MSNAANAWPEGDEFNEELFSLNKPSSSKINAIAERAVKLYRHYKLVVHSLEKFVRKSTRDTRLLSLYVIDAVLRRSRARFLTADKDVYTQRLGANMMLTFAKLTEVRSFELEKVAKVLGTWRTKGFFSTDLQEEMEAICESQRDNAGNDEEDDEEEERRRRERADSPVAPTGEEESPHHDDAKHTPTPIPVARVNAAARDPRARDPRRAAQATTAPSSSFPALAAASPTDSFAALANLQSILTPATAPAGSFSAPVAAPVPAPIVAPIEPPPPPPPMDNNWDYDDEESDEEEDEEARMEKLRLKLEQEKTRMESVATPVTPAPPTPTHAPPPPPPHLASPVAEAPRRSRFSAPKTQDEVDAAQAGGFPVSGAPSYELSRDAEDQQRTAGRDDRRRSRSRSPPRDFNSRSGPPGARPGAVATRDLPGFVVLPSSYQDSPALIRTLGTTLWISHETLESLGIDFNAMRTYLREIFQRFGQVDSIMVKDKMSFIKFRTRAASAAAKLATQDQPIYGHPATIKWAKGRDMEMSLFNPSSGEGALPHDHTSIQLALQEEPNLDLDVDFRDRKAPGQRGGGRDNSRSGGGDRDGGGRSSFGGATGGESVNGGARSGSFAQWGAPAAQQPQSYAAPAAPATPFSPGSYAQQPSSGSPWMQQAAPSPSQQQGAYADPNNPRGRPPASFATWGAPPTQ